jgi:hypothetical protein
MSMSHIYQPLLIRTLVESEGLATVDVPDVPTDIAMRAGWERSPTRTAIAFSIRLASCLSCVTTLLMSTCILIFGCDICSSSLLPLMAKVVQAQLIVAKKSSRTSHEDYCRSGTAQSSHQRSCTHKPDTRNRLLVVCPPVADPMLHGKVVHAPSRLPSPSEKFFPPPAAWPILLLRETPGT